ncbi:MAG: nucleoside hydrolase [Bacteroidales bacterium]
MRRILTIVMFLVVLSRIEAHPWRPGHYIIIDTDGGIDDMKAICMLLASPDVRVLAVTISPGALGTTNAYLKVRSLLNSFYHQGIPVGINRKASFRSPEFPAAKGMTWGDEVGIDPSKAPDFLAVINEIFKYEKIPVSYVCLGGLGNIAEASSHIEGWDKHVKEIIWSSKGATDISGFNYNTDPAAAKMILNGKYPVRCIITGSEEKFFDEGLTGLIGTVNTPYAKKLTWLFKAPGSATHGFTFMATDELAALYLQFPDMFKGEARGSIADFTAADMIQLRQKSLKMLAGETITKNQVLKVFPMEPSQYFDDIGPDVELIYNRYGENEFVSGVIANELHRHLGVFAIIGVKMGTRAREYFNTGVDEFSAASMAGSVPPLSCMNDGIQVSTGATPGHGLLTVINDSPRPVAEFTYMGRTIRLTLKKEIAAKMTSELKEINYVYGLDSDIYWELVRKNAVRYWKELDRHEIFEIEEITR